MITVRGDLRTNYPTTGSGVYAVCGFDIFENTTSNSISVMNSIMDSTPGSPLVWTGKTTTLRGVYNNTAVGDREFVVRAAKTQDATSGTLARCEATTSIVNSGTPAEITIDVVPLDQPSNSALYVQGPVLGAQTGAAIPAGYVGEVLKAEDTGWNNATSASYRLLSLTLTPGVWDVQSTCNVLRNGATWTDANLINSATNQNSNPTESYITHLNQLTPNNWGVPSQIYRVSWNGTTNIMEGSTNTSSPLIYSRCYPGAFTGGPVQLWQKITARRVN
jgi:hypothetical protein